jgi:hypothetical protein
MRKRSKNDEKEKQEKTLNKRGKEARNHVQIVDELDLQFAQHVSFVGPKPPEEKPMRTSTRANEHENETRPDEPEIEEVVSQALHATEGEGDSVNNQSQKNIQGQEVLPNGGVPRHPRWLRGQRLYGTASTVAVPFLFGLHFK